MELDYLLFMRYIRSANFHLYVYSLGRLLPWMFAFDHFNYVRWMSIHHYDLEMLKETNPDIFHEFETNSNFVVSRTKNSFSSIGLDQCHEQLNKDIKDGGMVGLTEDEERLRHWMICSPEISRAVSDFEWHSVKEEGSWYISSS